MQSYHQHHPQEQSNPSTSASQANSLPLTATTTSLNPEEPLHQEHQCHHHRASSSSSSQHHHLSPPEPYPHTNPGLGSASASSSSSSCSYGASGGNNNLVTGPFSYSQAHLQPYYASTSASASSCSSGSSSNLHSHHQQPLPPPYYSQAHFLHHHHLPKSHSRSSISSEGSTALFSPALEPRSKSQQYSPVTPPSYDQQDKAHQHQQEQEHEHEHASAVPAVGGDVLELAIMDYSAVFEPSQLHGENGHHVNVTAGIPAATAAAAAAAAPAQAFTTGTQGQAQSLPVEAQAQAEAEAEAATVAASTAPPPNPPMQPLYISQLATYLAEMVVYLWYSPPKQHKASFPKPSSGFMSFCNDILTTTQVSQSVVVLALYFVSKLQGRNCIEPRAGSEYKLTISSLMLANKILDDHTYTNKTWSDVSGLPLLDLNQAEQEFLHGLDYHLHVSQKAYNAWFTMLQNGESSSLDKVAPSRKRAKMGKAIAPSAPVSPVNAVPIGSAVGSNSAFGEFNAGLGLGFDFTCPVPPSSAVPPSTMFSDPRPHTSSDVPFPQQRLQQQQPQQMHQQQGSLFDARWSFAAAQQAEAQRQQQQQQQQQQRQQHQQQQAYLSSSHGPSMLQVPSLSEERSLGESVGRKRRFSDAILAPPQTMSAGTSAALPSLHIDLPPPPPPMSIMSSMSAMPSAYTPVMPTPGPLSAYSMSRRASPTGSMRSLSGMQQHPSSNQPTPQSQGLQYYHPLEMGGFSALTSSLDPPQDIRQSRPREVTYYTLAAGQQRGGYLTHQMVRPYYEAYHAAPEALQYVGPLPSNAYGRPHIPLPRHTIGAPGTSGVSNFQQMGQATPVVSAQTSAPPQRMSLSLSPADMRVAHMRERALHPEARFVQAAMMEQHAPSHPASAHGNGIAMQLSPVVELPRPSTGNAFVFGQGSASVYPPGPPHMASMPTGPAASQSLNGSPLVSTFTPTPSLQSLAIQGTATARLPSASAVPRPSAYPFAYSTFANNGLPGVLSWPAANRNGYHGFAHPHQ